MNTDAVITQAEREALDAVSDSLRWEVFEPRDGTPLFTFHGSAETADALISSLSPGAGLDIAREGCGWVYPDGWESADRGCCDGRSLCQYCREETASGVLSSSIIDEASAICDEYLIGRGLASGVIVREDSTIGRSVMALRSLRR